MVYTSKRGWALLILIAGGVLTPLLSAGVPGARAYLTGGTVAELARRFEMNRSHVQMLLKKHGLHSKDFRNHAASAAQKEKGS